MRAYNWRPPIKVFKEANGESFDKLFIATLNYTQKHLECFTSKFYGQEQTGGKMDVPTIHIHGKLQDESNPIIFGYGDDNSDEYRRLENQQNDEVLQNFKTFQYLRTDVYHQLMGILDNSNNGLYIQLLGLSCGLTDKTLLRTIFYHQNVKRIEVCYHDDKEQNFYLKLFNVARIMDSKEQMRNKVVPLSKTFNGNKYNHL